jgi:hypothetical protein
MTTYARLHQKKESISSSTTEKKKTIEEEKVSKTKFNLIMDQLRKIQLEKEALVLQNESLNSKVDELQKQLNKVIEENSVLRRSSTESTTPKTPTSPMTIAPPMTPPTNPSPPSMPLSQSEPEGSSHLSAAEMQSAHAYAEINKKKKPLNKPSIPAKPPVKKVVSLPPPAIASTTVTTSVSPVAAMSSTPPARNSTNSISMSPQPRKSPVGGHASLSSMESPTPPTGGMETPIEDSPFVEEVKNETPPPPPPHRKSYIPPPPPPVSEVETIPSLEEVHVHIKSITQCIQELLKAAQSQRQNEFASCSQAIITAITKLTRRFPKNLSLPEVAVSIRELERSSTKLQGDCQIPQQQGDLAYHTRIVMNSAYDVAKAARFLVTSMEQSELQ